MPEFGPHIVPVAGGGTGGGGSFSAGVSTLGNSSGDTGTVSNQIVLAGGNNITLSQSTGAGGATVTISGANLGGAQTGISSIGNSQTTYTSGQIQFIGSNQITVKSTTGQGFVFDMTMPAETQTFIGGLAASNTTYTSGTVTITGVGGGVTVSSNTGQRIDISVAAPVAQTNQTEGLYALGNTTGESSSSTFDARTLSVRGDGAVSVGWSNSSLRISAPTQTNQSAIKAIGVSDTGNTAGNTGLSTGIDWVVAGSNNITASQSTAVGGPNTIWISGPNVGGAQTGISGIANSETTYTSGSVTFSALGAITIRSTTGQHFQLSVNSQTVQTDNIANMGVSTGGNTSGDTKVSVGTRFVLAGGNNVTVSQGTAAGATTLTISAFNQTTQSAIEGLGVSNTGNTAGNTGISTGVDWVLAGTNNVTVSQSTGAGGVNTIWFSGAAGGAGLSAGLSNVGNTSGDTATVTGRLVLAGGNNITLSGSTNGGSMTITVSAPNLGAGAMSAGASNLGNTAGSTGITGTQLVFVGTGPVSLSQSTGANGGTLSINAPATSSLSATGEVSISTNGSTISIGVPGPVTLRDFENLNRESLNLITNLTATGVTQRPMFQRFSLPGNLTHNVMHVDMSRATSGSNAFTLQAAIYTFVNSTQISMLASLQNVYSNTDTASISGIRLFRLQGWEAAGTTLSAGDYVMLLYASAANTASMNYSLRGGATANPPVGLIGSGTNNATTANLHTLGWRPFYGRYTTTTASPPASVAMTQVSEWTSGHPYYFHLGRT